MRITDLKFFLTVFILFCLLLANIAFSAGVMQSGNYIIQSDSLNFGGGLSSSTNFVVSDTLGEVGTGLSSSTSYAVGAGFWEMQEVYIAITDSANISLPNVGGISGGNSTGQSAWNVITDDPAGYSLSIYASTTPAMKSAISSISDYGPAGLNPDYTFTVAANSSTFGFSPEGTNIINRYRDNGSVCNAGLSDTTDRCWEGLSTTTRLIAQSSSANHPSGATTTVKYQVGIGASKIQEAGSYTAYITVTAIAL